MNIKPMWPAATPILADDRFTMSSARHVCAAVGSVDLRPGATTFDHVIRKTTKVAKPARPPRGFPR